MEQIEEMDPKEVERRLKERRGDFILLAVSPETLERLVEGKQIDPSCPVVSGETLAELIIPKKGNVNE